MSHGGASEIEFSSEPGTRLHTGHRVSLIAKASAPVSEASKVKTSGRFQVHKGQER
jgi:hypothetical protein